MSRYATMAFVLALGCGNKPAEKKSDPPKPAEVKPVASVPVKAPETAPTPAAALPAFNKEKTTLYDPRVEVKTPSATQEEAEKILSKLFTKRLKKMEECTNPDPGSTESQEDIASGQIAPTVSSKLTGAFTAPGLSQELYLVDVGECNAPAARESPATSALWVIVEKGEIKAKLDGEHISTAIPVDVDQNGTMELFTISINTVERGGSRYQYADLYMLSEKEAKRVESFSTHNVMNDNCSIPREDGTPGSQEIIVVSMTPTEPGKLPTFSGETLTGSCGEKPEWKPKP